MDVRLSNTAGYTNSSSDYGRVKASPKSNEADVVRLEGVHNSIQLKRLENQGVTVSTGEEQTVRALEKVLKALEGPETTLQVSVHKETKAIMVKVLNKDTGELIREIPQRKPWILWLI